jgi:hypothetical protein
MMTVQQQLRGTGVAIVTPFTEKGEIDFLNSVYIVTELDDPELVGTVVSVQSVNRSTQGSTAAGESFYQNQMAQNLVGSKSLLAGVFG